MTKTTNQGIFYTNSHDIAFQACVDFFNGNLNDALFINNLVHFYETLFEKNDGLILDNCLAIIKFIYTKMIELSATENSTDKSHLHSMIMHLVVKDIHQYGTGTSSGISKDNLYQFICCAFEDLKIKAQTILLPNVTKITNELINQTRMRARTLKVSQTLFFGALTGGAFGLVPLFLLLHFAPQIYLVALVPIILGAIIALLVGIRMLVLRYQIGSGAKQVTEMEKISLNELELSLKELEFARTIISAIDTFNFSIEIFPKNIRANVQNALGQATIPTPTVHP
jgi:hypothetical protein